MIPPGAAKFIFGDSEAQCNRLLTLVRQGRKTATCAALEDFEKAGKDLPIVGLQEVVMNWDGTPALVIETTSVKVVRFCDVDESFARAEGEDEKLRVWQFNHQEYLQRNGGFDPEMMIVCQRFRFVRNLQRSFIRSVFSQFLPQSRTEFSDNSEAGFL